MKHILALVVSCVATTPPLAGQANMDGQANVSTIDFLGEGRFFLLLGKSFAETMILDATTGDPGSVESLALSLAERGVVYPAP